MIQVLTREPRELSSNHSIERLFSLIAPTRPPGFLLVELRGAFDSHQAKHSLELVTEHDRPRPTFADFILVLFIHIENPDPTTDPIFP